MIEKKSKYGFTLVELMVIMLFVTLVIAAAAPIITKRVKEVPRKLQHGKYICYRDEDGNLMEDYYNSSKFLRTIDVAEDGRDQCKFTPPTKASLFRIELIGAGAGGYSHATVDNYEQTYESTYLTASGRMDTSDDHGNGYKFVREPSNPELYRILRGATYTFSVATGSAGSGGKITVPYAPTAGIKFKLDGNPSNACAGLEEIDTANLPEDITEECRADIDKMVAIKESIENSSKDAICKGDIYKVPLDSDDDTPVSVWDERDYVKESYDIDYDVNKENYSACKGYLSAERKRIYKDNYLEDVGAYISSSDAQVNLEASGSYGGSGKYLYYTGVIDYVTADGSYIQPEGDVKGYLAKLLNGTDYVQKGSVATARDCGDSSFSTVAPTNGTSGADKDLTGKIDTDTMNQVIKADDGTDVNRFAAIRMFPGADNAVCVTTTKKPTAGKGATVIVNDFQIWYKQKCSSSSSTPCEPSGETLTESDISISNSAYNSYFKIGGYGDNRYPNVRIYSNINVRKHQVGNGGSAGKQATYYTTTLGDDCEFIVPAGGALVYDTTSESEIETMEENLATKLSCNNGFLNYRVDGGEYEFSIVEKTYDKFWGRSYSSSNGTWSSDPETYETVSDGGSSIFHSADDMFTRYKISDRYSFGAGGKGAKITDRCTGHYGTYQYELVYYNGSSETLVGNKTELMGLDNPPCGGEGDENGYDIDPALPGQSGAVIISW